MSTIIAVSESTHGPIGINMATYLGYITLGPVGGIISTLALVTPSIIVILIIANMLEKFKESKTVKQVFNEIRPFVVGFSIEWLSTIIFTLMLFAYNRFNINPILIGIVLTL